MLKKLYPFLQPYKKAAILSPLFMIFEAVMDVVIPKLMSYIINFGIPRHDIAYVTRYGIYMILVALLALGCGVASSHYGALAGMGFAARLREALFHKVQDFSFANLDRFSAPSLITRLTTDTTLLGQVCMMSLRMAWRAPFMLILAWAMAYSINAEMALIFAVALPLLAVTVTLILKTAAPRFRVMQAKIDRLNAKVQENLSGIRVVKSFVRQDHAKKGFRNVNQDLMDSALHAIFVIIAMGPIMMLLIAACMIALLWFGGNKIMAGSMLTGDLLSFLVYTMQILISLMLLSMFFFQVTRGKASADRILEVLEAEVDITDPTAPLTTMEDGSVRFEDVHFTYPGNQDESLSGINLTIPAGSILGIIGSTGSSKSTLIQLIPRLYDVDSGRVLVGGHDVRDYELGYLRDQVAVVLQKNTLFSGTVRENMQWGQAGASDEAIWKALEQAQARDFIEALEGGLDGHVERGGTNFSGGQRQRLCIARALLKHPQIMILDDSTSAVDTDTDQRIRAVFRNELQDMTSIIITQRISSIDHADQILVMDDGRISGLGTHAELLAHNEIYQEVYESQKMGAIA